jgi:uracil-DNA glycosylase family 4
MAQIRQTRRKPIWKGVKLNVQVKGDGPKECKIALIGEAPGAHEARVGKPFIGKAGQALNTLLASGSILRSTCYITNVVKEQPYKNDIAPYVNLSKKLIVKSEAYEEYEQMLYDELRGVSANVLVPLGAVPLYALTRKRGITKWRGSILHAVPELGGRKVVPTIHPAAALRQHTYTYFITHDLKRVRAESETPVVKLPERTIRIRPSFTEVCAYLDNIHDNKLTNAVDIEIKNLEVSCIAFAIAADDIMCIPFVYEKGDYFTPEQEAEVWLRIARILENPDILKIGQNFLFDMTFLFNRLGIVTRHFRDTMTAHGILYPDFPKGLDFMCSTLTREPYYKDDGKEIMKGLVKDDEQFWIYNGKDGGTTYEIDGKLQKMLEKQGNMATFNTRNHVIEPLMYMQERGIRVNLDALSDENTKIARDIGQLKMELQELLGVTFNKLPSPKQLKQFFYIEKSYKPYTKDGKPTTDDDALKRLEIKGSKEASLVRKLRKLVKLKGTYLEVKLTEDGRLKCGFNPVGTVTGTLPSSKTLFGTGTNLQNLPPDMRKFLIADEGYAFVEVDLSQAENRIVAYIAPEPMMQRAFEEGIDLHRQTFGMMFLIPILEVSDEPGSCKLGDGSKSQRWWGKQLNHSLNYGLGSITGRWGDDLHKEGYAHTPQSIVADKIDRDGLLFLHDNQSTFKEIQILMQVHDSILTQVPIDCPGVVEKYHLLQQSLEKPVPYKREFVIPAEFKVGSNWGEMTKADTKDIGRVITEV